MNCEQFQNWLLTRSDEPESEIEESDARAHMAECAACRDACESFRFVLSVSRSTARLDTPPARIDHLILNMARKRESHRAWVERLQSFFILPVPATVIALVFVASFTLLYYLNHGEFHSSKSETAIVQRVDPPHENPGDVPSDESPAVVVQPEARTDDDRLEMHLEKSDPAGSPGEKKQKSRAVLKGDPIHPLRDVASEKPEGKMDHVMNAPMPAGDEREASGEVGSSEIAVSKDSDAFSFRLTPTPTPTPTPSATQTGTPAPTSARLSR